jgi:hypothetical protein
VCNKAFPKKSSLKNHNRIHKVVLSYCCHGCNKTFIVKRHILDRECIDGRVRPYCCYLCKKFLYKR